MRSQAPRPLPCPRRSTSALCTYPRHLLPPSATFSELSLPFFFVRRRHSQRAARRTPQIRAHLVNVYATLAVMVAAACVGSALHMSFGVGSPVFACRGVCALRCVGRLTSLLVVAIGLCFWLAATPNTPNNKQKRQAIVLSFGAAQGLTLGPLVEAVLEIESSIVFVSFMATVLVFACFSAAALLAERRSHLYLGGLLSSGLSFLCMASFANLFLGSRALFDVNLYGGLLLFVGFVIFDTQLTVEKAAMGDLDTEMHALNLFTDLVAIFVRIMIILSRNKKRREGNSSSSSGSSSRR